MQPCADLTMKENTFLSTLISVLIAAGALGGVVNYFLNRKSDPEGSSIGKSITVGIGAAFLVPLFLNMISSNLTEMPEPSPHWPVLQDETPCRKNHGTSSNLSVHGSWRSVAGTQIWAAAARGFSYFC
jgi:hypothetical protein